MLHRLLSSLCIQPIRTIIVEAKAVKGAEEVVECSKEAFDTTVDVEEIVCHLTSFSPAPLAIEYIEAVDGTDPTDAALTVVAEEDDADTCSSFVIYGKC